MSTLRKIRFLVITWIVFLPGILGLSLDISSYNLTCEGLHVCPPVIEDGLYYYNCYCDDLCHIFGDCCANEAVKPAPNLNLPPNIGTYASCEYLDYVNAYVISSCPLDFADELVKTSCENLDYSTDDVLLNLHVSHTQYGIPFRNVYCALCHGLTTNAVTYWKVEMTCRPVRAYDLDPFQYEDDNFHNYDYHSPMPFYREDDLSGRLSYDEVDLRSPPAYDTLNGLSDASYERRRARRSSNWQSELQNKTLPEILDSPDFSCYPKFSRPDNVTQPRSCQQAITCPPEWPDDEIRQACNNHTAYVYYFMHNSPYKNKYCAVCNGIEHILMSCQTFRHREMNYDSIAMSPMMQGSMTVLLDFNTGRTSLTNQVTKTCDKGSVYDIIKQTCRVLRCPTGTMLLNSKCIPGEKSIQIFNASETNGNYTTLDDYGNFSELNSNESRCPMVELEESFYVMKNGSVFVNISNGAVYTKGQFEILNDTLMVCADLLNWNDIKAPDNIVQGILSFVGLVISIVSLLVLLVVYCIYEKLRTFPGKCLMCLASSLCVAQLSFLVGFAAIDVKALCFSLGLLTHFSFLAAFFWMNVMSFDIWWTFRRQFVAVSSKRSGQFLYYCLYSFLFPLAIVILSVVFDKMEVPYLPDPNYGKGLCWINNKDALLYIFALPVGIIVLVNYVFFAMAVFYTYHSLSGNQQLQRKSKSSAKRTRLVLYLKLSSIMGLTWVFGFAAAISHSQVLWYFFIVFNSLQGLFICLAFLCNRKVFRLVSESASQYSTTRSSVPSTGQSRLSSNA